MGSNTALEKAEDTLTDERRDMHRIFPAGPLQGRLSLHMGDQSLEIAHLRDVSPFGLGVQAPQATAPGTEARLTYKLETETIELKGTVLWAKTMADSQQDNATPNYQLGIKLDPSEVANNLRFYRSFAPA